MTQRAIESPGPKLGKAERALLDPEWERIFTALREFAANDPEVIAHRVYRDVMWRELRLKPWLPRSWRPPKAGESPE